MQHIVSLVIVLSLLVNCTYVTKRSSEYRVKDPVVVSERVGEVIDSEEREYFNLFLPEIYLRPATYRYESALFRVIDGGGYELRISTATGELVVVNNDPQGIQVLRDYIDNYEAVTESRQTFEEKWGIVTYDSLGLPITKNEIEMTKKRISTARKSSPALLKPVMIGASLGSCLGGIIGYVLIANRETEHDVTDPGVEGTYACLERTCIGLEFIGAVGVGCLTGGLAGGITGLTKQKVVEPDFEESIILDAIKETRKPRVVE